MSERDIILKSEGIYKSYRMGVTRVKVLKGLDLAVERGEFAAIVGRRAAAKARFCTFWARSTSRIRVLSSSREGTWADRAGAS